MADYGSALPCQLAVDLEKDVKTLKRIVSEGNGEPSLVSRVTATETKLAAIIWLSCATLAGIITTFITIIAKHF